MATYALTAEGNRLTRVTADEARRITAYWDVVRAENEGILVKINLGCRAYDLDGAEVIVEYLTPELVQNVTIVRLDDMIAGVKETFALRILKMICDCFLKCRLTFVNLSSNALGSKGLEACDSVLGQQTTLEELYFHDNGIAEESMQLLAGQLAGSEHLRVLHFYNNMVGSVGAEHFAVILRTCEQLENVRYSNVRAGVSGSLAVARALDENAALVLKKLDLEGSTFKGAGVEHLCRVLERSTQLTYLDIGDCGLEEDRMEEVCNALVESDPRLTYLNLSENVIGAEGDDEKPVTPTCCDAIASVLYGLRESLVTFKCDTNYLTSYGAERMMLVYDIENAPLEKLYMSENAFGHRAAVALERAVLPNLKIIKLNGNGFMLRDVTRLEDAFGEALQEMEDNDEDAKYDLEMVDEQDDEVEEELAVANAAPQREDPDDLDFLSQQLSRQHF